MSALEVALSVQVGTFVLEVELQVDARGLALVGPNGAGKTTTLKAILGVARPARGRVRADGATLYDDGAVDLPIEERRLAYVPQHYGLFPHLTAEQNVAFALGCWGRPERGRARAMLDRLGVGALAGRRPAELSGGERQRVALARALAVEPRALLLDEPLAALDVERRDEVRASLVAHLASLGRPFLLVTHDRADIAALGAPVAVLEQGRVVQRGTLAELQAAPATPFVRRLVGG